VSNLEEVDHMYRLKTRIKVIVGMAVVVGAILYAAAPALGTEPAYFATPTGEYPYKDNFTVTKMTVLENKKSSVICGKVEFTSELTATSETVTLTPHYSECEANYEGFVKMSATVSPGSCKLEISNLKEGPEVEGAVREITGKESIEPSTCGDIKVETPIGCTIEVAAQGPSTGTIIKPDGEDVEVTSNVSEAKLTDKGCPTFVPPWVFKVLADGVIHWIIEFVNAHFTLWYNNAQITGLEYAHEGEGAIFEIRNPNPFVLYYYQAGIGNLNWNFFNVPGQPGTFCQKVVFLHLGTCRFEIKSPFEKPAETILKIKGFVFTRAELGLRVK
jgi:hypothetical protein